MNAPTRRRGRKKEAPAAFPPRLYEERYALKLRAIFRTLNKALIEEALQSVTGLFSEAPLPRTDSIRTDAVSDILELLAERLLSRVRVLTGSAIVKEVVDEAISSTDAQNKRVLDRQFKAVAGIPYPEFSTRAGTQLELARVDNIALIKNLGEETANKVHQTLARMSRQGARASEVGKELSKTTGFSIKRATLIARDQTQKLHGELTRIRQTEVGIVEYVWQTALDERVRDEHAERHGERFKWASPPEDGHPGTPVLCRCTASPVIEL